MAGRNQSNSIKASEEDKALITDLLEAIKAKLKKDDFKPSLGDFIRLLQMERDLEGEDAPKEIRVKWSDLKPGSCTEQ